MNGRAADITRHMHCTAGFRLGFISDATRPLFRSRQRPRHVSRPGVPGPTGIDRATIPTGKRVGLFPDRGSCVLCLYDAAGYCRTHAGARRGVVRSSQGFIPVYGRSFVLSAVKGMRSDLTRYPGRSFLADHPAACPLRGESAGGTRRAPRSAPAWVLHSPANTSIETPNPACSAPSIPKGSALT